eukprot:7325499-Karenia_brevis.AAC.1
MGGSSLGKIIIANKKGRVEQVVNLIDEILSTGVLKASAAASLRGRLIFADQQCMGRMGSLATR